MHTPQAGEKYYHFKDRTKEYEVVCIGKNSETEEDMVVYRGLYDDNPVWIRPLAMFVDMKKNDDGTEVQRFTKIG
jgi:uncharacterized protein